MMTAMQKAIVKGPWMFAWCNSEAKWIWVPEHMTVIAEAWANRPWVGVP